MSLSKSASKSAVPLAALLAAGLSGPAHAATPKLPKLPPRTGELVACPSQEVLATRFSTQNNQNGGGFGYYAAAYDANRQPSIVNPKESWVADYAADRAAGRMPSPDEKMTTLWGLRCAYPELEYVKVAFEATRAQWLADTGVSPETEVAWHTLLVDVGKTSAEQGASCPKGDAWHPEDPPHLARQYALCGGMEASKATANLLDYFDVGGDPVVAAGVVIQCAAVMPRKGDGRSTNGAYWDWMACQRVASTFDGASLDAALRSQGVSDWVRLAYTVKVETAQAALDKLAPGFSKLEQGWPATRQLWDATVAQVDEHYAPILAKWSPVLDEVDDWVEALRGGPGFAGDCATRWGGEITRYLSESGVKPQGTALWEALRSPIGVGLVEAYALCRDQTGFPGYGRMVAEDAVSGVVRATRWHRGLNDALRAAVRTDGTFGGAPLPSDVAQARLSFTFTPDVARQWLRVSDYPKDPPYSFEETVAGITVNGDVATITFPKRSGTAKVPTDCTPDYSHVARIDEYGKLWYDWKCASSKTVTLNTTYRPVEVPAWEIAKIAAGVKVAVELSGQGVSYRVEEGGPSAVQGDVVWVKKGEDVVAALGFAAP